MFDGKVISSIIVFLYSYFFLETEFIGFSNQFGLPEYTSNFTGAFLTTVAWLISVAPSMGEEHGAVGDYKEWWGPYKLKHFGRFYGVKKALQRGAWMGFIFMLLTPYTFVGFTSLLFVPAIFAGQSVNRFVLRERGWTIAEPVIGGLCIGLGVGLS